jgi:aminoglycoside phosphotransferase
MLAGLPRTPVTTPAAIEAIASGRSLRPVWMNELGGLTFEVGTGSERCFVKWAPAGSGLDLAAEAARIEWAVAFTPVPRLLDKGADEAGTWIVTSGLPGENAVDDRWKADPATAVCAIGRGLRALHNALPVKGCPFSWSVEDRLAEIDRRASSGLLAPANWHEVHRSLDLSEALDLLAVVPPIDQLVVCHGDACAPNTLLTSDGRWSGHVDLGSLGSADRWADLAIATWSADWNYGHGWEVELLAAYGVVPDPDRMRYYRLLWDLGP